MRSSSSPMILALLAGSAVVPAGATAQSIDPVTSLIREYSRNGASDEYFQRNSDEAYERYVLTRPDFPYANVVVSAIPEPDEPTRRVINSASTREHPVNARDLHNMKVWDLGFTKARLWNDIHSYPAELRPSAGFTNITKAGIETDIYEQALRFVGPDYPAIAANYAVAAQRLRAKLASTPRQKWAEQGLRHDVIDRFVHAKDASGLQDFDLHYLIQFLDGAMASWSAGNSNVYGVRELPVPFQIARMAAAYRERLPFDHRPCLPNGTYDPKHAGMGGVDRRPLCFVDATDRAVHTWYAATLRAELASIAPARRSGTSIAERMARPLRKSGQGWIGIARGGSAAMVSRKEVADAKAVEKLLGAGEIPYRDAVDAFRRALRLTCKEEL